MAEEECPEGAPAWLLTYGDMITLVLCFFVLLFSMSEIRKDKVTLTMKHFQKQFGVLPAYKTTMQIFQRPQIMTETQSFVLRRGRKGDHTTVQTIRESERTRITIGDIELFQPNSIVLSSDGKRVLKEDIAPDLQGYRNRIDVRGHTASDPSIPPEEHWDLGYRRAYAVMRYLTEECDLNEERFRVTSCGDNEPIAPNQTEQGRQLNRRVEVIMSEEYVQSAGLSGQ